MKKAKPPTTSAEADNGDQAALAILLTLADTTWRIFTPVILCTAIGIWADLRLQTKPWITLSAVALGFGLAILLVRAQLQRVAQSEKEK